VECIIY